VWSRVLILGLKSGSGNFHISSFAVNLYYEMSWIEKLPNFLNVGFTSSYLLNFGLYAVKFLQTLKKSFRVYRSEVLQGTELRWESLMNNSTKLSFTQPIFKSLSAGSIPYFLSWMLFTVRLKPFSSLLLSWNFSGSASFIGSYGNCPNRDQRLHLARERAHREIIHQTMRLTALR